MKPPNLRKKYARSMHYIVRNRSPLAITSRRRAQGRLSAGLTETINSHRRFMRIPLSDYSPIPRDVGKHILFLGDLLTGTQDTLLTPLVESLKQEYYCMYASIPKGPRNAVAHVAHLCISDCFRPDLIVACGLVKCNLTEHFIHHINDFIQSGFYRLSV